MKNPTGQPVYNLWVDGDGTYTVNGYGTTSIIGDGGLLRNCVDRGVVDVARASALLIKFTEIGRNGTMGIYILNNLFGKLDYAIINQIMIWAFKDDSRPTAQRVVMGLCKTVGFIANLFKYRD
jgi:hypothetical protein